MTAPLTLKPGDRFWLDDHPHAYTALKIQPSGRDDDCFFVTTSVEDPPMLVCAEDVVEIVR
jgi:hypothetical protein